MARMKKRMSSLGLQPARRAARLIVGAAGALACTAVLAQGTAPAEAPTVLEGASLAAQMGCVNCHGAQPRAKRGADQQDGERLPGDRHRSDA